jgi:hypothetical protein
MERNQLEPGIYLLSEVLSFIRKQEMTAEHVTKLFRVENMV